MVETSDGEATLGLTAKHEATATATGGEQRNGTVFDIRSCKSPSVQKAEIITHKYRARRLRSAGGARVKHMVKHRPQRAPGPPAARGVLSSLPLPYVRRRTPDTVRSNPEFTCSCG